MDLKGGKQRADKKPRGKDRRTVKRIGYLGQSCRRETGSDWT